MADIGGRKSNDGPTMIYIVLFKKPASKIGVSNIKWEFKRATISKFGNNVKYLLDGMFPNYSIIIDKWERHKDYVRKIFRALLSVPNGNFNRFIESTKDDWDTLIYLTAGELIQNFTDKHNNVASAKEWTKIYPKDVKIIALNICLYKLEGKNFYP